MRDTGGNIYKEQGKMKNNAEDCYSMDNRVYSLLGIPITPPIQSMVIFQY